MLTLVMLNKDKDKFTYGMTVQIQISQLMKKQTGQDLHCLQRMGITGFSKMRVNNIS